MIQAHLGIKGQSFAGSSLQDATMYHDLPYGDLASLKFHRGGTRQRVDKILEVISVKDKTVLDIGCSVGGISLGLALAGGKVCGVDYDSQSIEVAREANQQLGLDCSFVAQETNRDFFEKLERVDVCIWLSHWMWLVKQYGLETAKHLLMLMSSKATTMIFESAANDGMAAIAGTTQDVIGDWFRNCTVYDDIRDLGVLEGWMGRKMLMGYREDLPYNTEGVTAIIYRNDNQIRKIYYPEYAWMAGWAKECLQRLDGLPHFPRYLAHDEKSLTMEYCGERIKNNFLQSQVSEILESLKKCGIRHRDIQPNNLLELDGQLYLIDFGWALIDKKPHPNMPTDFGGAIRRNPGDYDDEYAITESFRRVSLAS